MAKILKRQEITEEIIDIISSAKETLIIVSPYIKLTPEIKKAFLNQENKILIYLVFFRDKIEDNVFYFFDKIPNVIMFANSFLHTKCYMNEKKALLTSMNLYKYSMENNFEMGVLFRHLGDDKRNFLEIKSEMDLIMKNSHCLTEYKIRAYENQGKTQFCTSCSTPIFPKKNMKIQGDHPMDWQKDWVCENCYIELKKYEKEDDMTSFSKKYGNYCFQCGNKEEFSLLPGLITVCVPCMKKDLSPIEN